MQHFRENTRCRDLLACYLEHAAWWERATFALFIRCATRLTGRDATAHWRNAERVIADMAASSGMTLDQMGRALREFMNIRRRMRRGELEAGATGVYEHESYVLAQHLVFAFQPSAIVRRRFIRRAAEQCGVERGWMADLGCGPGVLVTDLLRRHQRWRAEALDLSVAAARYAKRLGETAALGSRLQVKVGDLTELPYPDGCFDFVVCSEVLEHVSAPRACLSEIARTLKPKGHAAITVPIGSRMPLHIQSPPEARRVADWLAALPLRFTHFEVKRIVGYGDDLAHALILVRRTDAG